jgi:hypothetical protein
MDGTYCDVSVTMSKRHESIPHQTRKGGIQAKEMAAFLVNSLVLRLQRDDADVLKETMSTPRCRLGVVERQARCQQCLCGPKEGLCSERFAQPRREGIDDALDAQLSLPLSMGLHGHYRSCQHRTFVFFFRAPSALKEAAGSNVRTTSMYSSS